MRALAFRLRRAARRAAWLLLGHTPAAPAPAPKPARAEWGRWLATAGGLGAGHTYPHGALFGLVILVLLVWNGDDNGLLDVVLALPYCALPGYLATRRTGSIWAGAASGAITAAVGGGATIVIGVALLGDPRALLAVLLALPLAGFGLIVGAVGGAIARPRLALHALLNGLREP